LIRRGTGCSTRSASSCVSRSSFAPRQGQPFRTRERAEVMFDLGDHPSRSLPRRGLIEVKKWGLPVLFLKRQASIQTGLCNFIVGGSDSRSGPSQNHGEVRITIRGDKGFDRLDSIRHLTCPHHLPPAEPRAGNYATPIPAKPRPC